MPSYVDQRNMCIMPGEIHPLQKFLAASLNLNIAT